MIAWGDLSSRHWVVFDLGGTTIYDRGEVPTAFTDALREAGIALDPKELTAPRGASKYEAFATSWHDKLSR